MANKRYNLALPQGMFDLLQQEADKKNVPVSTLLKQFAKFGLIVDEAIHNPDKEVIIRELGHIDRIVLFL